MKFPEAGRAEIVDVPVPVPRDGEALVRVRSADECRPGFRAGVVMGDLKAEGLVQFGQSADRRLSLRGRIASALG
jgi:hypothetical protein